MTRKLSDERGVTVLMGLVRNVSTMKTNKPGFGAPANFKQCSSGCAHMLRRWDKP